MKVRIPHPFFRYASQFTMESMILAISNWARELVFDTQSEIPGFSVRKTYTITTNNHTQIRTCNMVQTWLIDMLYHILCKCQYGQKEINKDESLHLISLYNNYANELDSESLRNKDDVILYVFGSAGEQMRIQGAGLFFEEFSREKYILDTISYSIRPEKSFEMDVKKEFYDETGFTTDEYSIILLLIWGLFTKTMLVINEEKLKNTLKCVNPILSYKNVLNVLSQNSITVEEIRKSPLERQVFYTKPIIKIENDYIATNPYLVLSLFTNSTYWVLRNKYKALNSQRFTNAFGCYYEEYLREVLSNCISQNSFERIEENSKEKRADWHIKIDKYEFFVEQKSSLSFLGMKHSHPDVNVMKKYMLNNWGEAIKQLSVTQKHFNIDNAIKIILVYEDYHKSKCLDELFRFYPELMNDNHFWLLSINEFETLLQLCKTNIQLAIQIIEEKNKIETERNNQPRELKQLFSKHDIKENLYLREQGIFDQQFERIQNQLGELMLNNSTNA